MNRLVRSAMLAAVMLGAACDESPTKPSDLEGRTWRLVSFERAGVATMVVADPSRYTLQFAGSARVNVRSDCNTCAGTYALTGASVSIGALACTRAFCGDTSLDTEYMQALQTARALARAETALTIRCDGVVLRFVM